MIALSPNLFARFAAPSSGLGTYGRATASQTQVKALPSAQDTIRNSGPEAESKTRKAEKTLETLKQTLEALDRMKKMPDEAREAAKARAKARLEAVRERLKILEKAFAHNPKEMAKALKELTKELKAALKEYKDAGGTGSGAGAAPAPSSSTNQSAETKDKKPIDPEANHAAAETGSTEATETKPELGAADVTQSEAASMNNTSPAQKALSPREILEKREGELKGDEEFGKMVKGLANKIKDLFFKAKVQAEIMAKDKARDKAFEEFTKEMKDLDEGLGQFMEAVQGELADVSLQIKMMDRAEAGQMVSIRA
ncbi:MAG: hypothetical protein ACK41P_05550 [Asticcacaulis sp.]